MPFADAMERAIHFVKHGHKFGAATEEEYERMADAFLFGEMHADTSECTRPPCVRSGLIDRLRFGSTSRHFGVACTQPEFLRTFYPVEPKVIARHGGAPGFFRYECARVMP